MEAHSCCKQAQREVTSQAKKRHKCCAGKFAHRRLLQHTKTNDSHQVINKSKRLLDCYFIPASTASPSISRAKSSTHSSSSLLRNKVTTTSTKMSPQHTGRHRQRRRRASLCCLLLALLAAAFSAELATLAAHSAELSQRIEAHPEARYMVQSGDKVRLACQVSSLEGECAWLRNGGVVGKIKSKYEYHSHPQDGDCSLTVHNASVAVDDGKWQCQVTATSIGADALHSQVATLVVMLAPEKPIIKNTTVRTTGTVCRDSLRCTM